MTVLNPTQWRRKPIVVTAVQLNTRQEAESYPPICTGGRECKSESFPDNDFPHIHSPSGHQDWTPGWWCITGDDGEYYFCEADVFAEIYEPVKITPTTTTHRCSYIAEGQTCQLHNLHCSWPACAVPKTA